MYRVLFQVEETASTERSDGIRVYAENMSWVNKKINKDKTKREVCTKRRDSGNHEHYADVSS